MQQILYGARSLTENNEQPIRFQVGADYIFLPGPMQHSVHYVRMGSVGVNPFWAVCSIQSQEAVIQRVNHTSHIHIAEAFMSSNHCVLLQLHRWGTLSISSLHPCC